jgi:cephalosporin hydroxylase
MTSDNFVRERVDIITAMGQNTELRRKSHEWLYESAVAKYSYVFSWMGVPIVQYPQDILAMQEILWDVRPDLIIETGVARGGSLVFYASILELIGGESFVVGIDIDIRAHNRAVIEAHLMFKRIRLIQGSSIDPATVAQVRELTRDRKRVLVALDSNHTHEHVLRELELYSPLVTKDSYLVVFDTVVEDMPKSLFPDRPWGPGDNPKTAVREFLKRNDRFQIDHSIENKLQLTVAPDGYLRCVKS